MYAPASAQAPINVPDGFVGPVQVTSIDPFIVSERQWKRGDETIELVQDVPPGTKLPRIPLPKIATASCRDEAFKLDIKNPQAETTTYYVHETVFSNVGGNNRVRYRRPGTNVLPEDVKSYMDAMCAEWTSEKALSVPATPPPTPAIPQPPAGFLGGPFKPTNMFGSGLYEARWHRATGESLYVLALLRPLEPDPGPEYTSIGTPMSSAYHFFSRENAGACAANAAQIVSYSIQQMSVMSYVHVLYVAGSPPILAAYSRSYDNAFPADVRAYFGNLCEATLAAAPPGSASVLPEVRQRKKNAPFVAPDGWTATFSAPTIAIWNKNRGRIEATLLAGQSAVDGTEAALTKAIFYPVPLKFSKIALLPPCSSSAQPSWSARYEPFFKGGSTSVEFAVFRATPIGLMKVIYSRPADTAEDPAAIQSLLTYCP